MSLATGTRFNTYLIGESIGVGGMGEVYRATDSNLKREVALKVLPGSFAKDADRLARFQREAEVLAALNHVNIAHIYGLERSDGITALVMELVDGQTLAERLEQGALPSDEALNIAMQIAEALEAAHERGIVHRDLKPANIKLTSSGVVKVLDFGIAKALDTKAISGPQAAQLTTPAMTEAGIVLGTAAYMSPEQARGKPVDQRADIWAFGCVLYEMLTGQLAFGGEDVTTTLARILERDADLAALPASVAPAVKHTIKLCLEKNVRKRFADIRDVKLALSGIFETLVPQSAEAVTAGVAKGRMGWFVAAAAVVATVVLAIPALQHLRETAPPPPPEVRLELNTPATAFPNDFALSPDGRQIVFVAADDGEEHLWLRSLASTTAQPLAGTEGARRPFWSRDSRSIGFFTDTALKRIELNGGTPRTLAPVVSARGGSWSTNGTILFTPHASSPLMQVPAAGGTVTGATTLEQQQAHFAPFFLPDGRRFVFSAGGSPEASGIFLGTLDGSAPVRLTSSRTAGVYLPSGWLLWVQEESLMAQRLDLEQAALIGEPLTLADGVSAISSATTGLVAYRRVSAQQPQLTWVDRAGTVLGTLGEPGISFGNPRVAPDGNRVVVTATVQNNADLWLLDGVRRSRLTFDPAEDAFPLWSADGTRIAFRSQRSGGGDLYIKPANAAAQEELLVASDEVMIPSSWSADGRFLMYVSNGATLADLWVLALDAEQMPSIFQQTGFHEAFPALSPDGRWVAFHSNESGRNEIYLRPFVAPGTETSAAVATGQWQVSTAGGIMPLWSPDGSELYYLNPEGDMMAAPITVTETSVVPGTPVALFAAHIYGGGVDIQIGRQYDVARDGRFLINRVADSGSAAPIVLIQNWNPEAAQ